MKKAAILLSGHVGKASTQLLLLWLFARTGGPGPAGEFAFAVAISFPVFILFEFALRNVYQTLHNTPSFRIFFAVRTACVALALALVIALAHALPSPPKWQILAPLLLLRSADSLLDMCFGSLQNQAKIGQTAMWMWANSLSSASLVLAVLYTGMPAEFGIWASGIASTAALLPLCIRLLRREEVRPHSSLSAQSDLVRILRAGFILGFAQALGSVLLYMPTWFLSTASTPRVLGVFAVCQYSTTFANMVMSALQQVSLQPLRTALAANGQQGLIQRARVTAQRMAILGAIGAGATLLLLPVATEGVLGESFAVGRGQIWPLAAAIFVLSIDYATTSAQLVLNRYGARITVGTGGVAAALLTAAATFGAPSIFSAGLLVLAGTSARAVTGLLLVTRTLRLSDCKSPVEKHRSVLDG